MTEAGAPVPRRSNGAEGEVSPAARAQFGLAHGWLRKGRYERAVPHLRRALELDPDLEGAHVRLATVLVNERAWSEALAACEAGLSRFQNHALLHKLRIRSLRALHGHTATLARHGLVRVDETPLEIDRGQILATLVVRDEFDRLAWFLDVHRRMGVSWFLAVDNGSTDGTLEYLRDQPDVAVWCTDMSFNEGNFGSAWFEVLLGEHGLDHWVLMLDADEVLTYPRAETTPLREFCLDLDRAGIRAVSGTMLDMYGEGPVEETRYPRGEDFLDHAPFFDRVAHDRAVDDAGPFDNHRFHFGGARRRVFGDAVEYLVTKTPLVRYDHDVVLAGGQHFTSHPADRIAHDGCAVLHFKWFASMIDRAATEATREEHSGDGEQYKAYRAGFTADRALQFHDPEVSVAFEGSDQLVTLEIMNDGWRGDLALPAVHRIPSPPAGDGAAPRWSVMISVHRRLHTLERAVRSVLDDAPDGAQIAVVADHHEPATADAVRELVTSLAGAATVELHQLDDSAGHPGIFDECIARARGEWVHILHDDDWVRPGFYGALDAGIEAVPGIGAAFTRHDLPSPAGRTWTSWLERDTPGVIDDWLDRIATECRVQFSAMAVRRTVYETVGGFTHGIGSAFDWEMWQRIAVGHDVWFDPEPLAVICRDGSAETDRLMADGGQVADSVAAIEHARKYLPADRVDELTRRARERFALHGIELAEQQLRAGQFEGAQRNLAAALGASTSPAVVSRLHHALAAVDPGGDPA